MSSPPAPSTVSLEALVQQWLSWDRVEKSRSYIDTLWKKKNTAELERLLCTRMEFGTAGLRAIMGPGNAQMNSLTIIQTAQGLLHYLQETFSPEDLLQRGVVIGFDGRYDSDTYARLTSRVMKEGGVRTYCFQRVVPTPFVPFSVLYYGCVAGVMVTASHNPKEYNGYKVYWENGAQIIPPHDAGISASIEKCLAPCESSWTMYNGDSSPDEEVFGQYFQRLGDTYTRMASLQTGTSGGGEGEGGSQPSGKKGRKFVYTAMHGVGAKFTIHSLKHIAGIPEENICVVKEQEHPDPEFPTVKFPNPEEGPNSLVYAMNLGNAAKADVILANDPDADRLCVAERLPPSSSSSESASGWRIFNGNETGALLGWWAIFHAKHRGDTLSDCVLLSSTVSSCILGTIAKQEGMQFIDTLTGFKWMGSVAHELLAKGKGKPIFSFEEAIGFCWGTNVFDKDGVTAAAVVSDMANYVWEKEKRTLVQKLEDIYQTYGYHFSSNSYVTCTDAPKKAEMFRYIQTKENGAYPKHIAGVAVHDVRDLSTGLDTRTADKQATLPLSKSSPLVTFYLDQGIVLSIRGSGTEPKIKWYSECVTKDPNRQQRLKEFTRKAVNELIRPDELGLIRRPEDKEDAA